ncbi:hypothetical protein COOONC_00399 [Cooperia oncophora]
MMELMQELLWSQSSVSNMENIGLFKHDDILKLLSEWPSKFSHTLPLMEFVVRLGSFWVEAFVCSPLFKKPPHNDPGSHRPISITSVFCTLFEKIIKELVVKHLEINEDLPECQHVFKKGRSTVS